jgi:hypothetical protein
MARVRRTALDRARLIDKWRESGLSLPSFCSRQGIKRTTMSGWIYKPAHRIAIEKARRQATTDATLREVLAPPATTPAFVSIEVAPDATPPRRPEFSGVEIVLSSGQYVRVAPGFDRDTLRRVITVLEDRLC